MGGLVEGRGVKCGWDKVKFEYFVCKYTISSIILESYSCRLFANDLLMIYN